MTRRKKPARPPPLRGDPPPSRAWLDAMVRLEDEYGGFPSAGGAGAAASRRRRVSTLKESDRVQVIDGRVPATHWAGRYTWAVVRSVWTGGGQPPAVVALDVVYVGVTLRFERRPGVDVFYRRGNKRYWLEVP